MASRAALPAPPRRSRARIYLHLIVFNVCPGCGDYSAGLQVSVDIGAAYDTETLLPAVQAAAATGMQVTTVFADRNQGLATVVPW